MVMQSIDEKSRDIHPSGGTVIEEDQAQREFYKAVTDWSEGHLSYEEMYKKIPDKSFSLLQYIAKVIISYLRHKK